MFGDGPTMPMRSLSNDNYDRVWIAQGDHIEAMGVGDTPQEAAIEYARAVADLRERLEILDGYVTDLEGHVDELHAMMVKAGLQPPPRPKRPRIMRGGAS